MTTENNDKQRILIVDDESDITTALKMYLEIQGFHVDAYTDPANALARFKAGFYHLLILDIKMPEMNGFSFYREIKKLDGKMKVCFLTAGESYHGASSDIFSSLLANCFIRKPVTNEELLERLDIVMCGGHENYCY